MARRPEISAQRAASIFKEMVDIRRLFCGDRDFFRMTDFWTDLSQDNDDWTIKLYRTNELEDYKRKAGVIEFAGRVTLTVDERLWKKAVEGCLLSNFTLAHEAGHVGLDHYAQNAVVKNFQLFDGPKGMSNLPPTQEELEANYAAVFLQCGALLMDQSWSAVELARRAYSEVGYVKKAMSIVALEPFRRELDRLVLRTERVVL